MFKYKLSQFSGDYQAWFASIANQILQSKLFIKDEEYEIFDISVHFYSTNFNFPHCKQSLGQKSMGKWFYQEENHKILDITFTDTEDKNSYGGILLRGIKNKDAIYDSPIRIHNLIKNKLGDDFLSKTNGNDAQKGELSVKIKSSSNFVPHYSLPRENLSPVIINWSDDTSLKSSLFPMRFCTRFPKFSKDDLLLKTYVAYCFLHGYEHEMKLLIDSDKYQKYLDNFLLFLNKQLHNYDIQEKSDLIFHYSKFLIQESE